MSEIVPKASCVDLNPVFALLVDLKGLSSFPERQKYIRVLLEKTVTELRETADYVEKELRQCKS